nr:MAG TPA: hypothetical protein [Caudoviricetes sp.]
MVSHTFTIRDNSSYSEPPIGSISLYPLDNISLLFRCIDASELCLMNL